MFDGTSRAKRNVSLRGKSKEEDKRELSRRAERQREERARERVQATRSVTIQRFLRGRTSTHRRRRAERHDWDAKMHDLEQLQAVMKAAGASFMAPASVLLSLQSQLLFFYAFPEDLPRLGKLCTLLDAGIASNAPANDPLALLAAAAEAGRRLWLLRMSKLALVCLHALGIAARPALANDSGAAAQAVAAVAAQAPLASLLDSLTSPAAWTAHGVPQEDSERLCGDLLAALVLADNQSGASWAVRTPRGLSRTSLFPTLTSLACATPPSPAAPAVCRAALRAICAASASEYAGPAERRSAVAFAFATTVLPVPGILEAPAAWENFGEPLVREAQRGFWLLAEAMAAEAPRIASTLSPTKAADEVANLLRMDALAPAGKHAAAFVHLLSALLRGLPLQSIMARAAGGGGKSLQGVAIDDPMDVGEEAWDDDIDDDVAQKLDVVVRRETLRHAALRRRAEAAALAPAAAEAAAATVRRLVEASVVARLFDAILPASTTATAAAAAAAGLTAKEDDAVLSLCQLYAAFVLRAGDTRPGAAPAAAAAARSNAGGGGAAPARAVLSALAFSRPASPIVRRLWEYLGSTIDPGKYAASAVYADARPGAGAALLLLCTALSHQLLAEDDEDFYERQVPLPLSAVRVLVAFLRDWLCRLYWTDPALDRLPAAAAAAAAGSGGGSSGYSGGSSGGGGRSVESALTGAQLMLAATRLFNQLYERNSRRSFCEATQWYWPAISSRELQPPDVDTLDNAAVVSFFYGGGKLALVLSNIPQVIPFQQRVAVFRRLMESEKAGHQAADMWNPASIRIRVRRETLYEDSFAALNSLGAALRGRVQVTLINEHGVEEAGIDGGGVFKEFMDSLTKRAFDPQYGIFQATSEQLLYPNPASALVSATHLEHFEFMGRILGKALYEGILVEPQFSAVFLSKLLGRHTYVDDLYSLDPELYRGLTHLKALAASGGDVSDLALTFCATTAAFGEVVTRPLLPGGDPDAPVTNANVVRYIHAMANFKLNVETAQQCRAFLRGFRDLIPVEWVGLFSPHELQQLIGGDDQRGIDLENLRANTVYAGGYHPSQPIIGWFWDALKSFSATEQALFLRFVTSCSRQPLLGFEHLAPPICVQKVPAGGDGGEGGGERLPSSATCMNLLKLPDYRDARTLRDKLLYAISSGAGFELT